MAVASSADAVLLRYPSRVSWLMAVIVSVVADSATEEATLHVSIYREFAKEWRSSRSGWSGPGAGQLFAGGASGCCVPRRGRSES